MTIERKTELGRDLQRRADACQEHLKSSSVYRTAQERARLQGKLGAYAHAAELADLELIEARREIETLQDGARMLAEWCLGPDVGYHGEMMDAAHRVLEVLDRDREEERAQVTK